MSCCMHGACCWLWLLLLWAAEAACQWRLVGMREVRMSMWSVIQREVMEGVRDKDKGTEMETERGREREIYIDI